MVNRHWSERPLFDIASYGRKGPGERIQFSKAELELIHRTVTRTPEVMVKVLTKGGQNLKAVERHMSYLSRHGDQPIHTDEEQTIQGKEAEARLLRDWDLDLDDYRRSDKLALTNRAPPKLVHKLLFSMPPGTPPDKVLKATQNFAREQFALKHRYAMVLHTDEPHPHVHLVLKALSEEGKRLNIKKATLREWRSEFARHLRELGVPANATERAVRDQQRRSLSDGRYRTQQRGISTYELFRQEREGKEASLSRKPSDVQMGWKALVNQLTAEGHEELAQRSNGFYRSIYRQPQDRLPEPPSKAR